MEVSHFEFVVRRARLSDLGKIYQLERRVWRKMAASPDLLRRRFFLYPRGLRVAEAGSDLAGFCFAVRFDQDARDVELDEAFPPRHIANGQFLFLFGLTVNPIYRRRGVARAIVDSEVETAWRSGCSKIQVIANDRSRALFGELGFTVVGDLSHLFQDFPDEMPGPVLMELSSG